MTRMSIARPEDELDRLDLEVQRDQRENEALEILHQVVEASQAFRVVAGVHVGQRADFRGAERDLLVADAHFELLGAHSIRRRPGLVVLLHDLAVLDYSLQLLDHALVHVDLLLDDPVVLVVAVVRVAQLAVRANLELEELVAELAFVAHVVAQVETVSHSRRYRIAIATCGCRFRGMLDQFES